MSLHTAEELKQLQAMPLEVKIAMSKTRIRAWINEFGSDGVYISFSGGKDSTVLLDIVREIDPDIKAMFVDTGLEYPEIRDFVRTFDNVDIIRPKMNFRQVIDKYGYPFISKEVSECVYGAKKYLTEIALESTIAKTDRQTDRQTDRHKYYNQFAKLCGLGQYSKRSETKESGRAKQESANTIGSAPEEQRDNDGEYP